MQKLFINLLFVVVILQLSGCGIIHKLNTNQGNVVTPEMVDKLKVDMDKNQVLFVLGTPLIEDPFHADRWDYVFNFKPYEGERNLNRVTIYFKDNKVVRIDKDIKNSLEPPLPTTQD